MSQAKSKTAGKMLTRKLSVEKLVVHCFVLFLAYFTFLLPIPLSPTEPSHHLRERELLHIAHEYNCQAVQRGFLSYTCDVIRTICEHGCFCVSRCERLTMRPFVVELTKLKLPATDQKKQRCFGIAAVHVWGLLQTFIKLYLPSESHILTTHKGSPTYLDQY